MLLLPFDGLYLVSSPLHFLRYKSIWLPCIFIDWFSISLWIFSCATFEAFFLKLQMRSNETFKMQYTKCQHKKSIPCGQSRLHDRFGVAAASIQSICAMEYVNIILCYIKFPDRSQLNIIIQHFILSRPCKLTHTHTRTHIMCTIKYTDNSNGSRQRTS